MAFFGSGFEALNAKCLVGVEVLVLGAQCLVLGVVVFAIFDV